MLAIDEEMRVYLWLGVMDMRVGFDRLALFVKERMQRDILSGGLYVFLSRRRDRVKIMYWDIDGYALWFKRLEAGMFRVERVEEREEITGIDLQEILRGVELNRIRFRKNINKGLASPIAL